MADKKLQPIIIKKIYEEAAGAHGGAWKVAFADFMTAMMCFFLVMWLLNQSEPVRKQIASYFTGPSVLEQNFKSYGAELTFEKLFLDIVNEPLKALQTIMDPADLTPNILAMGSKKMVLRFIEQEMGKHKNNVIVEDDRVILEIPDTNLFEPGTGHPSIEFLSIMTSLSDVTRGLEDSNVIVESEIYQAAVPDKTYLSAAKVGQERLDLVQAKVEASLENATVKVMSRVKVTEPKKPVGAGQPMGYIRITMAQKATGDDGRKARPLDQGFGKTRKTEMKSYDDYVDKMTDKKKKR